jgi:type VI secretion system secreted protein VgrG
MARTLTATFEIEGVIAREVVAFELVRELGRPPVLDIEVRFSGDVSPSAAVGSLATLAFGHDATAEHTFIGVIEAVTSVASPAVARSREASAEAARFRVVSRLALLDGSVGAEIFQDRSVDEIVKAVLAAHGVAQDDQDWQLGTTYPKREYCVRYMESAGAFVARLLEEEGIYHFTTCDDGKETLHFRDESTSSPPIDGEATLHFRDATGLENAGDAVFSIVERAEVKSGRFVLRDYDFRRPSLDMTVKAEAATETDLERYDYPGLYVEPSEGKRLARVRLEAERASREVLTALTDCARVAAGRTLRLEGTKYAAVEGDYLVTKVVHAFGGAAHRKLERVTRRRPGEGASAYVAAVELIPKATPYRTPQTTPRPVIDGPETATVVAPQGSPSESIHTDEHGRCKVKFHWDLAPGADDKASCWMRVAQLQTSGSMLLPRIDWEVVVEFQEGNPDRPLVTGMIYNGQNMPPYALPEGKTRTVFQTRSTPGGGGTNEIRFEDRAGGEEIMMNAKHDHTLATAGNKTKTVGKDASRTIGGNETIDVSGNQTTKVTMGQRSTVGGDQSISVGGNRNVEVNAVTGLTAGGSSQGHVGGNHFEMDGNPLQALLNIATQVAIDAAQAAAHAAMDRVNAAIQSRVDQAMGPVQGLTAQAEQLGAGMEAIRQGDLGAIGGMAAQAAGLPVPPAFGGAGGGGGGGGDAARGGGGGGGDAARGGGGASGGEGASGGHETGASYTAMAGVDAAVDSAIERGMSAGAAALGAALGLDGAGGGGQSTANADGPVGDVGGLDGTDRSKGPGHSIHSVGASLSETTDGMRIRAALMGVHTQVGGSMKESVGAAKLTAAVGDITADVGGSKDEKALGLVHYVKGDDAESIGGSRTVMVGGVVYDKVGGARNTSATSQASIVGAFHKIEASGSITFKCGASSVVIDGSGVTITSPIVTITAGKIQLAKSVDEV